MQTKSVNILSLEGKDLIKEYTISPMKKYKATFDHSLELIKIKEVANKVLKGKEKNIIFQKKNDSKLYSNAIINVSFEYSLKEYEKVKRKNITYYSLCDIKSISPTTEFDDAGLILNEGVIQYILVDSVVDKPSVKLPKGFKYNQDTRMIEPRSIRKIMGCKEIREHLYQNGFIVNGKKYVRFKRSSGSARVGKCLFIREELYPQLEKWSYMGLDTSGKIDLASLEAYISLTTSSIIDTIEIQPENILLINDFDSHKFTSKVMVTKNIKISEDEEVLKTYPDTIEFSNNIWDGQSMLCSSLFEEKYKDKGFLLLRNRYFKSACFNTNIQKFFSDNNITEISQLNGETIATDVSQIKLITTQSSIKYMKFGKFSKYIKLLEPTFGIVKYDKPTHYFNGDLVSTHYQLINTVEFNENDMREFLKNSVDYIKLLRENLTVFKNHIQVKIDEDFKLGINKTTTEFVYKMLQYNDDFQYTDMFKRFRKETVANYISNIKYGHVLVRGNYGVLFGNPLEMLKYSANKWDCKSSSLGEGEVYTSNFEAGEELVCSRSPHVTISNVLYTKNTNNKKCRKDIETYFNLSKQIVCLNSFNDNVLERLSSADFDADSMLQTNDPTLKRLVRENYDKFLVPTSLVESSKVKRENTALQKADLDQKTSVNLIGEIVNASQILNSMYWHYKKTGQHLDRLDELFADICQLDVASCIEIDRAKKEFVVDTGKELELIRDKWYIKDEKSKKVIRPLFFKFITSKNEHGANCGYVEMFTGMDLLHRVLEEELQYKRQNTQTKKLYEIIANPEEKVITNGNKYFKFINIITNHKSMMFGIWNSDESSKDKFIQSSELKKSTIKKIQDLELGLSDVRLIILRVAQSEIGTKNIRSIKHLSRTIFSILYNSNKKEFNSVLKENRQCNFEYMTRDKIDGKTIEIYGISHYFYDISVDALQLQDSENK